MVDIDKIIRYMDDYIKEASKKVSDFYSRENISFGIFEGTKMELTPTMCERIYKDLIKELVENKVAGGCKMGLCVVLAPSKGKVPDGSVAVKFRLGVLLPDIL